jgi:hypothetical protein
MMSSTSSPLVIAISDASDPAATPIEPVLPAAAVLSTMSSQGKTENQQESLGKEVP